MNRKEWILAGVALASRIPFASRTLYDFDCVAFALGLEHFDVSRFQPHPPGYTFYLLAGRLARFVLHHDNAALVAVGMAATAITSVLVYRIGRALFSEAVGFAAALMLLSSPLFWTYGCVAAPYATGAMAASAIALLCLAQRSSPDFALALGIGLALGMGSGFRPDVPVVLTPLALVSSWRLGRRGLVLLGVGAVAGLALWFVPTIFAANGWEAYRTALAFQSKTIAFSNAAAGLGRPAFIALNIAKLGTYAGWAMGPVAAVSLAMALGRPATWGAGRPLLLWALPYVLLVSLVAFGQPGMMLTALPAFMLLAASLPSRRALASVTAATILVNTLLFVAAPGMTAGAFHQCDASLAGKVRTELLLFSARGIRLMDRFHDRVMSASSSETGIRGRYAPGETIVFTNLAAWPQATYYLAGYRVHDFFAFSGFDRAYPDPDIHLPAGRFPLPPRVRHVILLDGNRHSPALGDCVVEKDATGRGRPVPGIPPEFASHVREIPVDGTAAITIGEEGQIRLEPRHAQ